MALITCTGLSLGYDGKPIVSDLNFEVRSGDYLCILGENGSGKSTLMRTLLGLQKPLSGRIDFGEGLRRNQIGYLPQQTPVQRDFPASVREIVLSGCLGDAGFRPFYTRDQKKRAEDNMARMDVTHLAKRCYRELSGGQQQRVLLARALCAADRVLLLDEPVAGLDPKVTEEMYALIRSLNEQGMTVIMISHDLQAALRYAGSILHIGQSVFFGTRDAYLESREGGLFGINAEKEGGTDD